MNISKLYLDDRLYRYSFYESANEYAPYGIFLMGNLQEIESVDFFSLYFSKDLHLFTVEVPGTGLTDPLLAEHSIQEQAEMLALFIKKMGIDFAHVLAFSYATPFALELCSIWSGALTLSMCGGMAGISNVSLT